MSKEHLLVATSKVKFNKQALIFSKRLNIPFLGDLVSAKSQSRSLKDKYILIFSDEGMYLKKGTDNRSGRIFCDFLKWSKQDSKALLLKTMKGLTRKNSIIDATAGFGKDSLILSSLTERLTLIERTPWVFSLLEEGIGKFKKEIPSLQGVKLIRADSKKYLNDLNEKPDAIYLDPMFEKVSKSKAKKNLQALRELTKPTKGEELLKISLTKAANRVVVKRHKKSRYLSGLKPTFSLSGRVIRYDVYSVQLS